jgi:hypothetical protein
MRLFHRTSTERAKAILRDGFKDNPNPPAWVYHGVKLPWYKRIFRPDRNLPPLGVWFSDVPIGAQEGIDNFKWGVPDGDTGVLFLLEIPDEVIEQLNAKLEVEFSPEELAAIEEFGAPYTEYVIPVEVVNRYGPPIDITDNEADYAGESPDLPRFRPEADD